MSEGKQEKSKSCKSELEDVHSLGNPKEPRSMNKDASIHCISHLRCM